MILIPPYPPAVRTPRRPHAQQHGHTDGIEDVVLSRKRFQYEDELRTNPLNYDLWFDYIRLEEVLPWPCPPDPRGGGASWSMGCDIEVSPLMRFQTKGKFKGAHRALCARWANRRLFSTSGSHRSQVPEFCTPDAVLNGLFPPLWVGGVQGCSGDEQRNNWHCACAVQKRPPSKFQSKKEPQDNNRNRVLYSTRVVH